MLLALGVLVMTVGLIRSETVNDLRILTAAGANSRARRALTAATASGLGFLGAVIGTAVAHLAAAAYFHAELDQRLKHVPVTELLVILVAPRPSLPPGRGLSRADSPPPSPDNPSSERSLRARTMRDASSVGHFQGLRRNQCDFEDLPEQVGQTR
jgi:putative ABC transport system permease protein